MKCKKLLTSLLAIALVVTSLYPTSFVKAATTTKQDDGLNFLTGRTTDNDYYYTDERLTQLPATFEATYRIGVENATSMQRAGTILGNAVINETNTSIDQTGNFNFGFINGMYPYIWVADAANQYGTIYKFNVSNTLAQNQATFITGEWIHLAIVNDTAAKQMYCYVNGELWGTLNGAYTGTWTMSANQLRLGGDNRKQNSQNFKGDIRNVAIFKDARTAAEVKSDYQNGIKGNEDKLMGAYNLKLTDTGVYPAVIEDLSPNNFDFKKDWITESEAQKLSGRKDYDYSMAIIGDPQIVTAHAQTVTTTPSNANFRRAADSDDKIFQWVVDNAVSRKIQFAFNLGDLNDNDKQWESGLAALQILDDKVPYSIVRGNHDHVESFKQYIKYEDYADRIEGSFDGETMLNTYQKFEVQGHKYMVINLDFGVGGDDANDADAVLAWANELVENNPDYKVIVTTHAYQASDGTRLAKGEDGSATTAKTGYYRQKDGEDIWNEFASLHENIIMVLSGHVGSKPIVKAESIGVHGNKVIELMVNPQEMDKRLYDSEYMMGGMVAMLYFSNDGNDVSVEWYSTQRDYYYTTASQFSFDMSTMTLENGEVALRYDSVDTTGAVPVSKVAEYKDYVFAGWFSDATCETTVGNKNNVTETSYAKFIPKEILSVKAQVSTSKLTEGTYAGNWVMRFVSSVESLDYKSVGFKVTYEENGEIKTKTSTSTTVYERIKSTEDETEYGFSTGVIDANSKYFITGKLPIADTAAAKATTYTVQAYVETKDGTISYGPARILSFNDSNGDTLNVTVQADKQLSTTGTYTATYGISGTEQTATKVEVLSSDANGYSNIRITLDGGVSSLKSATRYIITDANGRVATDIYRNYYTTHESGTASAPNADTSWYEVDPYADEFVLASSADMYGFAKLVDGGQQFAGKTVRLIRDVKFNKGTASKDGWVKETSSDLLYSWNPIGSNTTAYMFNGTFDGGNCNISGIYTNVTTNYTGLFSGVRSEAVLKNFSITNSYLKSTHNFLGAACGFTYGVGIENIYSDAIVVQAGPGRLCVGGIVGRWSTEATNTVDKSRERYIKNCWYDGEIYIVGDASWIGGIVAQIFRPTNVTISDILFSGKIFFAGKGYAENGTYYDPYVGGISGSTVSMIIKMKNVVDVGTIYIDANSSTKYIGSLFGVIKTESGSYFENCYTLKDVQFGNAPYASALEMGSASGTVTPPTCLTTENALKANSEQTLKNLLGDTALESWTCYTDKQGNALGAPILYNYSELWLKKQ